MTTYMLDSAAEREDRLLECPTCGRPAHIEDRFILAGAPSPVEHVKLVCVAGHWFTPPVDQLPAAEPKRHGAEVSQRRACGGP
jgi:hypothetical protein